MAGRKPTPTALKLIAGNPGKRALSKREPTPTRAIPTCPEHLSATGKTAWNHLTALLDGMSVLTEADGVALGRLCDCFSDILACRELIASNGYTYQTCGADGSILIKANPAVSMLRAADSQFKSYLGEFGLTPAARSKVRFIPEESTDETDRFFAA
jgi:P27 family predicted phage terminase small subunit